MNMKYGITNYLAFLIDLWKITKDDGGFKAFYALIAKHRVSTSMSAVLCEDLEWVSDDGALYVWRLNKPTKNDAETAYTAMKTRLHIQKARKNSSKHVVYESTDSNVLIDSIAELSKSITDMSLTDVYIDPSTKLPYTDNELNDDIKDILIVTAEEVAVSMRLYDLQQEYAKSQLLLETERKINFDEIDRLIRANDAMGMQITNLTTINSDIRDKLINTETALDATYTQKLQSEHRLNSMHALVEQRNQLLSSTDRALSETIQLLAEANAKIENTLKYKIQSWFRK